MSVLMYVHVHREVGQADTYCDLTVEFTVRVHGMSMGPITTFVTIIVSHYRHFHGHVCIYMPYVRLYIVQFITCSNFSIISLCKHSAI